MQWHLRRGSRLLWLGVLVAAAGVGFTATAVADDVAGALRPSHTENFLTVSDPNEFANELSYILPRAIVPLSREDAVAQELWKRNRTLSEADVRATAHALVEEADVMNQDPLLFLAVIHIESYYNHLAVSYVGAEGLMQLMPYTAVALAKQHGFDWSDQHSFDPDFNVRMGCRYLVELYEYFGNRMDLALTAYNRGPSATSHILRRHGGKKLPRDILDFYATPVLNRYHQLVATYGTLPL
jgi:soluble lytic murein transglycosylase-like protein